ncbi:MAG TPA: hypothetical protein DE027_00150 [Candidatus Marinimicrobia bacterium]|nr:hypothetical protein [Candidatus Neomarinimicrobiota bacterium]|tara:strand:- start:361 stop:552 length:192 start_codon:yes stop_codon:yes gene_type:complete
MSRNSLFFISIIVLILTVPWWFFEYSDTIILGLPDWAFYAVIMAILYSIVISYILGKFWKTKE